jgi:hypothetical protein
MMLGRGWEVGSARRTWRMWRTRRRVRRRFEVLG